MKEPFKQYVWNNSVKTADKILATRLGKIASRIIFFCLVVIIAYAVFR